MWRDLAGRPDGQTPPRSHRCVYAPRHHTAAAVAAPAVSERVAMRTMRFSLITATRRQPQAALAALAQPQRT